MNTARRCASSAAEQQPSVAPGPTLFTVVTDAASALVAQADAAWAGGDGETAMALFGRAVDAAEAAGDLEARIAAVLGLARGQRYNLTPGLLPVRLHAVYDDTEMPR